MPIPIHINSLKNIKLIDKILVNCDDLTTQEFKLIIKTRKSRIIGKLLQNL